MSKWGPALIFLMFSLQVSANQYNSILFVGDSHSTGKFGSVLDNYFRSKSSTVVSVGSCGSSPSTWITSDTNFKQTNCGYWRKDSKDREIRENTHRIDSFNQLLDSTKPDIAVISLGTNILSSPQNILSEINYIEKMAKTIQQRNAKCIWVSPPDLDKNPFKANLANGIVKIRQAVEKYQCHFIDSTQLTSYPKGRLDGIHYNPAESQKWAELVRDEIEKIKWPENTNSRTSVIIQKSLGAP